MTININVLSINPEIVTFIIEKAKEFQAKEGVTFDETMAESEYEYDWSQILADHEDDLTYNEAKKVIEDLEPDQQVDLLTLMYIGRGDYDVNEWSKAHKEARSNLAQNLTGYLFSKPFIVDYLETALELLGYEAE